MKKAQVKELAQFAMTICVWIALAVTVSLCSSGCMRLHVEAREGSTVNITESGNKTVTTTTDASVPAGALGL